MKHKLLVLTALVGAFALIIIGLAFVSPTSAHAAGATVTPNATTLPLGATLTVSVDGPVVIDQGGFSNALRSTTGACTLNQHGSYTNGGQINTYTCLGADSLTAATTTATTQGFKADGIYAFSVTVVAPVVVVPPPAPAAKYTVTTSAYPTATSPYVVTVTNVGNLAGVFTYTDTYFTPTSLDKISAPAGAVSSFRTVCPRFHGCYKGNGFVVKNISVAPGQTVTITVTL